MGKEFMGILRTTFLIDKKRKNYKNLGKCSCKRSCQRRFKNSSKYHKIKKPLEGGAFLLTIREIEFKGLFDE